MEKAIARIIHDRAEAAIKAAFAAEPMMKHISVNQAGGSIGAINATLKFSFVDTTAKPQAAAVFTGERNEDSLRMGLAPAGTEVVFGGKTYKIISPRRSKYVAQELPNGKEYLIPFIGCRYAPAKVG